MAKDNRKVYKQKRIEVDGNVITFDGKYNPDTNTLKIYRMYGDVSLYDQAIMEFCIDNKIGKAIKL